MGPLLNANEHLVAVDRVLHEAFGNEYFRADLVVDGVRANKAEAAASFAKDARDGAVRLDRPNEMLLVDFEPALACRDP